MQHIIGIPLKYFHPDIGISFMKGHIRAAHHNIAYRRSHCKADYSIAVVGISIINNGVIAERGTHSELILMGGVYTQLYETQFCGTTEENTAPFDYTDREQ